MGGAAHRPDVAAAARRNAVPQATRHVPVGAVPPMDAAVAVRGVALQARWRLPMVHAAALLRDVAVRRPPPVAADRCPLVVAVAVVGAAENRAMVVLVDPPRILLPNSNTIPWLFRPIQEHQAPILRGSRMMLWEFSPMAFSWTVTSKLGPTTAAMVTRIPRASITTILRHPASSRK